MYAKTAESDAVCIGCVYYQPNLPRQAYSVEDWAWLQARHSSFDSTPGDAECRAPQTAPTR